MEHQHHSAAAIPDGALTAIDPVCGMTVAVSAAVPQAEIAGVTTYFCCEPCRAAYVAEPERYA